MAGERNVPALTASPSEPIGGPCASGAGRISFPVRKSRSGVSPAKRDVPMIRTPESKTPKEVAWLARKKEPRPRRPHTVELPVGQPREPPRPPRSDTTDWALKAKRYRPSR